MTTRRVKTRPRLPTRTLKAVKHLTLRELVVLGISAFTLAESSAVCLGRTDKGTCFESNICRH
jgi:hypothetical protein